MLIPRRGQSCPSRCEEKREKAGLLAAKVRGEKNFTI